MGKKSRLKREKRAAKTDFGVVASRYLFANKSIQDKKFSEQLAALKDFFVQFDACEVILALGVSDLWLPNRSSQVKHSLAMLVALSIPLHSFQALSPIFTYDEFASFISKLKKLLPDFPMYEDFVPEADWGDIRVAGLNGFERIFYGGSVERIPDFIDAFRLLHADNEIAMRDMDFAIALQAHIIEAVDHSIVGCDGSVIPGHFELPTEIFWNFCSKALLSAYTAIQSRFAGVSQSLIVDAGVLKAPDSLGDFSEAFMMGTALPIIFARIQDKVLPIMPRAVSSVVIDFWHGQPNLYNVDGGRKIAARLSHFLSRRLREHDLIVGPVDLAGITHRLDRKIAAVVRSSGRFYFILPIKFDDLVGLVKIESQFNRVINECSRWALVFKEGRQIIEFRNESGEIPRLDSVQLVIVIAQASCQPAFFGLEDVQSRVVGLPDFVSIFDSIRNGDELDAFFSYLDGVEPNIGGMIGIIDNFGAFRDSHGILMGGAVSPDFLIIDPHWGSSWRFKELKSFWTSSPCKFPDDLQTWIVDSEGDGLTSMKAKGILAHAWSGSVGTCVVQSVLEIGVNPDYENGPLLELFTHCVIDAFTQRDSLLQSLDLFHCGQIVLHCEIDPHTLPLKDDEKTTKLRAALPLLSSLKTVFSSADKLIFVVEINLSRLYCGLNCAVDASFEAECVVELVVGMSAQLNMSCDDYIIDLISKTKERQPRFTLKSVNRPFDVPDYASPDFPNEGQFKAARKELAHIFKQQGVAAPARYELEVAKVVMNSARDAMRNELHAKISEFDRKRLMQICIAQHDELTAKYQLDLMQLKISLSHQVSFDRSTRLSEAYVNYTGMARNYRYLLEFAVSSVAQGGLLPTARDVVQLIARIDWLLVLYSASDMLHNGIDVGGIELDSHFVPTVFFSDDRELKEEQYFQDFAAAKLGFGLSEIDEVKSTQDNYENWGQLDGALTSDLGFSLTHMSQALHVLSKWHSVGGDDELRFRYEASPALISDRVRECFPSIPNGIPEKIIAFLTLEPTGVRRVVGKDEDEPDVPIWEHSKRMHRYLIRPLIKIDHDILAWGAASVNRTNSIWVGSIVNGYLPAEFQWPAVVKVVRNIKEGIEKLLEVRAHEIVSRHCKFVMRGIDFYRRFPKERFADVGDFDVLAYWPDRNLWLAVECKYNQPPFCLKDAKRLRERVFGRGEDRGQFSKIERRHHFLTSNSHRLRELLQWPESLSGVVAEFRDVYVCREISWWLKHPPYAVRADFVRVDALDGWLGSRLQGHQ